MTKPDLLLQELVQHRYANVDDQQLAEEVTGYVFNGAFEIPLALCCEGECRIA
jgi:hypothetical protein